MCTECNRVHGHADGCPNATLYDTYTVECALCEKDVDEMETLCGICEDCWMKAHTFENAISYGDKARVDVKINGLFAKVLSPEQIDEALKAAVMRMKSEYPLFVERETKAFLSDDDYDFAGWLKKQKGKQ